MIFGKKKFVTCDVTLLIYIYIKQSMSNPKIHVKKTCSTQKLMSHLFFIFLRKIRKKLFFFFFLFYRRIFLLAVVLYVHETAKFCHVSRKWIPY